MTNKKENKKYGCKDYEMFADDYFKSIFSKKSRLGHSKYVQSDQSDSSSKSSNKDSNENCYACANTEILDNTSDSQNICENSLFNMNDNFYGIKENSHEGKKCYIDEGSTDDSFTSYEEECYQNNTHKSSFNDSSAPYSYDCENINELNNKSYKCRTNPCSCKENSESRTCPKDNVYNFPHNHEISGSVNLTGSNSKRHNHRTCGLTSDVVKCEESHVHNIHLYTDTCCGHIHEICETTSKAIYLPNGKHFHAVKGYTKTSDGHIHEYYFLTSIDDPCFI